MPACSWRRAQRRPGDGFKIGRAVVEESAIELRISRDKRLLSEGWAISMNINVTGGTLYRHEVGEPSKLPVSDSGLDV